MNRYVYKMMFRNEEYALYYSSHYNNNSQEWHYHNALEMIFYQWSLVAPTKGICGTVFSILCEEVFIFPSPLTKFI